MKVVVLLEAGIPSYRNFLFTFLNDHPAISDLLIVHTGKIYNGKDGSYKDSKVKFVGSNKLGFHLGIFNYLRDADLIISSYNLRIISCWLPILIWSKKWIFWGKGLGQVETSLVLSLRKLTARKAKYILVYNEQKKKEMVNKLAIEPEKVIAYQNTIKITNPQNFDSEEKKYFLYFGRLQERKGLKELISVYKKYVDRVGNSKFKLRLVGNGEFKATLQEEVERLGLKDLVEFYPGVYDDDAIAEHFKHAKLYVSPFNVGLAIINSFAYGVPVLTCKEPQVGPEFSYLNDDNSFVVDNVDEFTDVFVSSEIEKGKNSDDVYRYFFDHLHYSVMENNFIDTILKMKDE